MPSAQGGLPAGLLPPLRRGVSVVSMMPFTAQSPSAAQPCGKSHAAKLTLWPLIAATFFMVCGGAYGTEDIVQGAGYHRALLILVLTPLLWSLPTAFMVGEL